jgi:hypothetical protein
METLTANDWLLAFVLAFWTLLALAVKLSNWWVGKAWSDGPSLIPVIPCFPVAALILGAILNTFAAPWGLWVIVGVHLAYWPVAVIHAWVFRAHQ